MTITLSDEQKKRLQEAFNQCLQEPETLQEFLRCRKQEGSEKALHVVNLDVGDVVALRSYLEENEPLPEIDIGLRPLLWI